MDVAAALLLCVYLVPFAVAEAYEHPHRYAVLALNATAGWTGIGWIVALAWALRARPRKAPPRPPLYVVGGPPPREVPGFWRTTRPAVLSVIAMGAAGAAVLLAPTDRPARVALSTRAALAVERSELLEGPSEGWARAGILERPCQVHVSASEGAWRRVWPLSDCGLDAKASVGWVRASELTAH